MGFIHDDEVRCVLKQNVAMAARLYEVDARDQMRVVGINESLSLPHSRPMPSIGTRCHELRIADRDDAWRIVYGIDSDAIVIVDVFSKRSRKTPAGVIKRCQGRLRDYDEVTGKRS